MAHFKGWLGQRIPLPDILKNIGQRIPLPDILKNISRPPFLVQIPYIQFTVPVMLDFNYPLILLPWKYCISMN